MKIAFFPCGEGGIAYYRCHNPMSALRARGHEVYHLPRFDTEEHKAEALTILDMADICFIVSPMSIKLSEFIRDWRAIENLENIEGKKNKKIKFVIDYDDNPFDLPPWNDKYLLWGREEVKFCGEWLWKNGMEKFAEGGMHEFDADKNDRMIMTNIPALINAIHSVLIL